MRFLFYKGASYTYALKKNIQEILGLRRYVLRDACQYFNIPLEEALEIIQNGKNKHLDIWEYTSRDNEEKIRSFYNETTYYCFSQLWNHWKHNYYFILRYYRPGDRILEYGCGIAYMSEWLIERRPDLDITVADIPSKTWEFAHCWLKDKVKFLKIGIGNEGLPLIHQYNIITCFDVLEHTVNPLEIVRHLYQHLAEYGYLFIDFVNEVKAYHLAQANEQREAVINFLNERLFPIKPLMQSCPSSAIYQKVSKK